MKLIHLIICLIFFHYVCAHQFQHWDDANCDGKRIETTEFQLDKCILLTKTFHVVDTYIMVKTQKNQTHKN
jgi:hypothetical protein